MSGGSRQAPRSARYVAYLVLAALAYYVVAVAALHWLESGLDPLERPISAYLRAGHPMLARTTFFALATALAALSVGLYRIRLRLPIVGPILLGLAAVGVVIAGLFPGPPLHLVGGLMAFPPTLVAVLIVSLAFRRAPGWKSWGSWLLYLGSLALALFLVSVVVMKRLELAGLGQRLFFAALFSWMAMVAWGMLSRGGAGLELKA